MIDIRQPNISAETPDEQLLQMRSYLYQLAQQLQWAFTAVGGTGEPAAAAQTIVQESRNTNEVSNFGAIKALIVKSSEIVEAYTEKIGKRLEGVYVSRGDFGTFQEKTAVDIQANSTNITQLFTSTQLLSGTVEQLYDAQLGVNAYVKTGKLYEDDNGPVYGLEIGQTNDLEGQTVFSKFARFTSDRLSFYDRNDTEVAYISDYKLYITNAEITGALTLAGRFKIYYRGGLAFQWIGGST